MNKFLKYGLYAAGAGTIIYGGYKFNELQKENKELKTENNDLKKANEGLKKQADLRQTLDHVIARSNRMAQSLGTKIGMDMTRDKRSNEIQNLIRSTNSL